MLTKAHAARGRLAFLRDGGEMGALMRAHEWSATTLGRPEEWSASLKGAVGLMLRSRQPACIAWGADQISLYNDGYIPILGTKHPGGLGQPTSVLWSEVWGTLGPIVAAVLAGEAQWLEDMPFALAGRDHELGWFSFSYTPLLDDDGEIAGFYGAAIESTEKVLTGRRQSFRLELDERLRAARQPLAVMNAAVEALGSHLGASRVGYSEALPDDETIVFRSCYAHDAEPLTGTAKLDSFGPDAIARQRDGTTEACDDVLADPAQARVRATWAAIDTRAFASVPLIRDGRLTASLYVNFPQPHRWTKDELALIEEVAARTWTAVEQAKAETALRESEARLRAAIEASESGTFHWDIRTNALVWDDALDKLFGLAPGQTARSLDRFVAMVHPDDRAAVITACQACAATGVDFSQEFRVLHPDGAVRWLYDRGKTSLDADGRPATMTGACVDVTERRVAGAALAASEHRFRVAVEAVRGIMWTNNAAGEMEGEQPGWAALTGQSRDEYQGYGWSKAVHPDDVRPTLEAWREALASKRTFVFEHRLRRRDGEWRQYSIRSVPRMDADGAIAEWVGVHTDVTERRRAETELRRLNADLERQVIERAMARGRTWQLSPDIMGVLNAEGYFEHSNPAWEAVLGWTEVEVASAPLFHLIHPDDLVRTQAAVDDLFARGLPAMYFENRYRHKDGGYRWLSWVAVPDDGRTYCNARDITDQKAQAEALANAEDALRQAQKMEAVGQFTGGLAHDFNNLLTGMMGNLELLQGRVTRGRLDDLDRFINAAQGAGRRAAALTQRLLAFSRRQTPDPKPTDVNRLIAGIEELLRRTVGPTYNIEVVQAGGLWTAMIDPAQLENALLNLCINARDAMADGGRLTIETANKWLDERTSRERDLPSGQYLSICVTDTGTGMTPEVAARAFDPFYTTKPIGEGTGLGLSMIYGFARQSGGQVRIYSEVGQGTTVCIYLPRHAGEAENVTQGVEIGAVDSGRGETVLVVDDEATIRHLIDEVLDDLGYTVIGAADGAAGLKLLQSGARIELLITDVGLPNGMNGRQVADAARALRPGLKVLFITGYAENAAVGNGHLEPGMELLTKPFAMADLTRKVQDMLAKAPAP